jgi:hypothetical protein
VQMLKILPCPFPGASRRRPHSEVLGGHYSKMFRRTLSVSSLELAHRVPSYPSAASWMMFRSALFAESKPTAAALE